MTDTPISMSSTEPKTHETATSTTDEPSTGRSLHGFRWFLVTLGIFSANLLYGLDNTIVADLQAAIAETFDNTDQLGWLGVGFCLGSTVAILPLGKAYAIFDTKWLYLSCLTMFAAGSALCGAAPSMNALIVGRVWAGAGGAGMYLGTLNLVSTTTTPRQQSLYIGLIGLVYGGGSVLGPIVGGLLADSAATWRWAFYLNLVIFAVTSPVYVFAIPSLPQGGNQPTMTKIADLDWLGIVLTSAMYVCLVLAFSFGGIIWSWADGRFIALVVLFVVFTVAFAVAQKYSVFTTQQHRLFPVELLRNRQLVLLYIAMACGGAGLFVCVYYIPLFFLFVHGESGTLSAVRLLPLVSFYVAATIGCGYLLPRTGCHWVWYLISGLFQTAGAAAMYVLDVQTTNSYIYGVSVLLGLGLTVSQAGYSVGSTMVATRQIPDVIQFLNISQGQSQLLGLMIASAVFQSKAFTGLEGLLSGLGYTKAQVQQALSGSRSQVLSSLSPGLRTKCLAVITDAIRTQFILVIVAGALLTITSLFLTKKRFPVKGETQEENGNVESAENMQPLSV